MVGAAKLFLESEYVCEYEEMKAVVIDEFACSVNSADVHKQLQERKKKKDELMHEYMLQMKKIAVVGDVEDIAVINYIVNGLDIKNEYKCIMLRCKSFRALKEEFDIYEKLKIAGKKNEQQKSNINAKQMPSAGNKIIATTAVRQSISERIVVLTRSVSVAIKTDIFHVIVQKKQRKLV